MSLQQELAQERELVPVEALELEQALELVRVAVLAQERVQVVARARLGWVALFL